MRKILLTILLLVLLKPALFAKTDIRFDHEYDPRITLRVVVLPATKDRSLRAVSERTISSMLATELLKVYEVVDLIRFEQFLVDRKFTLENAFSNVAEKVVRDSAQVDAIATVEVYRWDEGTGGMPLLGKQKGSIGVKIRMMDPFTGRLYWSMNRLEDVDPGTSFLNRTTRLFRDVVRDLNKQLAYISRDLDELDEVETMMAEGKEPRLKGYGSRKFTSSLRRERGFVPRGLPKTEPELVANKALAQKGNNQEAPQLEVTKPPILPFELLPQLLEDDNLEDIERESSTPPVVQPQMQPQLQQGPTNVTQSGEYYDAGPPPIPERFQDIVSDIPDVNAMPQPTEETPDPNQSSEDDE